MDLKKPKEKIIKKGGIYSIQGLPILPDQIRQWHGTYTNYESLKAWAGNNVKLGEAVLILQEPERTVVLKPGDFLVEVADVFYRVTKEEMEDNQDAI